MERSSPQVRKGRNAPARAPGSVHPSIEVRGVVDCLTTLEKIDTMAPDPTLSPLLAALASSRLLASVPEGSRADLVQRAAMGVIERFPDLATEHRDRLAFVRLRYLILEHHRSERSEDRLLRAGAGAGEFERGAPADPAEEAEAAEMRSELRRAIIEALSPDERTILLRHFQGGESMAEISASLGMSRATGARRLAHAIWLLARALEIAPERDARP